MHTATIIESLRALTSVFRTNELAYLALTSKPEFLIRDRLAFDLHSRLEATNRVVAREWAKRDGGRDRADIAILSQGVPEAVVELKAKSLFAILNQRELDCLWSKMSADAAKARKLCGDAAEVYLLLLAAHAEALPAPSFEGVVKYLYELRVAYEKYIDSDRMVTKAQEIIGSRFCVWPRADDGKIPGGKVFGVPVSLYYWLFGPICAPVA